VKWLCGTRRYFDVFEGLTRHLLKEIKGIVDKFPRMTYEHAMKTYGNDKPDIRFGMEFGELNEFAQHKNFCFQCSRVSSWNCSSGRW
jgi:aspartyl-tRNA synthetase